MKKGCLYSLATLIIIIGIGSYIIEKYGDSIYDSAKSRVTEFASEKIISELNLDISDELKDSLASVISIHLDNIDFGNLEDSKEKVNEINDIISRFIENNIIEKDDISSIKKMLKKNEE